MSDLADVTVVIPTAGREALTRSCIASIRHAAEADRVTVEIHVVDSSLPQEAERLRAVCRELGARFIEGPVSVSAKRNVGAEQARAAYVMFVDSDCTVNPGCFAAHFATLRNDAVHASQGTIHFRGPERWVFRAVRCSGILDAFVPEKGAIIRAVASGNLMVRREALLAVRFDPRLGPPGLGGEDVDLGMRLSRHGLRIAGTPGAVVHHETATWNTAPANLRRFFAWGRSEARLIERYPEIRYLDMPPAPVVMLLIGVTAVALSAYSPIALLAFPLAFACYAALMSVAGARQHPDDRLGGALGHWVFFVLDAGRVFESLVRGSPGAAVTRLRFSSRQVAEEWPALVPGAWSVWLMLLAAITFLWVALRWTS